MLVGLAPVLRAQDSLWQPLSDEGVVRASAAVDSVLVDRLVLARSVSGGDFAAYLMARLGVRPIPPSLLFTVGVDTSAIRFRGRIRDLPVRAQEELGPLLGMFSPETWIAADVGLLTAGPRAVHFRLRGVTINDVAVPDALLQPMLVQIGVRYPALTSSGRDLYVEIPAGAAIALETGAVRLIGPPPPTPPAPRSPAERGDTGAE
jgi:hypothetical protein